jgi:dihydrolipoamide dehydrogenase
MARHDLIVIGAGPGGYVAAIRAAQLGFNVACIDENNKLGGTCLRVGCIPSKALLVSSEKYAEAKRELSEHGIAVGGLELDLTALMKRKDAVVKANTDGIQFLFKKNKITHYQGRGEIAAPGKVLVHGKDGDTELEAERILIATGSRSAPLKGVEVDGEVVVTSTEALSFSEVPEKLLVIGAGIIGLELGSVWSRLGSQVTVLEYLDRILPTMDGEIAREALKLFKKQGIAFELGARVTGVTVENGKAKVEVEGKEPFEANKVLVAVGRVPNTEGLGLDAVGVETDARGCIEVDERFQTNVQGIYAIGDVIGRLMLAHEAEEEGIACVETIATGTGHVDYNSIPAVVYTAPEIAAVGKTEEQLKEEGIPYKKGSFPYMANGRARALGHTEGKAKILAHEQTDRILGVHIVGHAAGDLIAEAAVAMAFGASAEDIARASHAHPTLAEILKEAALAVDGRALHI